MSSYQSSSGGENKAYTHTQVRSYMQTNCGSEEQESVANNKDTSCSFFQSGSKANSSHSAVLDLGAPNVGENTLVGLSG